MNTKSEQVLLPSTIGINALRAKKKAINGMAVRKKGNRLPVLVRTISEYAVTMGMKATAKKVSMFMTNPVARVAQAKCFFQHHWNICFVQTEYDRNSHVTKTHQEVFRVGSFHAIYLKIAL